MSYKCVFVILAVFHGGLLQAEEYDFSGFIDPFESAVAPEKRSDPLSYCSTGGYHSGAGHAFVAGVAIRKIGETGMFERDECSVAWRAGRAIGEQFSTTGIPPSDVSGIKIFNDATDFGNKIYEHLIIKADL